MLLLILKAVSCRFHQLGVQQIPQENLFHHFIVHKENLDYIIFRIQVGSYHLKLVEQGFRENPLLHENQNLLGVGVRVNVPLSLSMIVSL